MEGPTRPSTVEVMILVNVIGAISILLFGSLVGQNPSPLLGISLGSNYLVMIGVFIVLILVSEIGLWAGRKWGMAFTIIAILIYLFSFAFFADVLALIAAILLVYYATRPLVKDWLLQSRQLARSSSG
jgi:hypothetical protein